MGKKTKPREGSFALCSLDSLGLIISNGPVEIVYPDGSQGLTWVGIHLTAKIASVGAPWSSRSPRIVGHVDDLGRVE